MSADERLVALLGQHELHWQPTMRPVADCTCGGWHHESLLDDGVEGAHRAHVAAVLRDAGWVAPEVHERSLEALYEQGVTHGREAVTEAVEAVHQEAYPNAGWCRGCHDGAAADRHPCSTRAALAAVTEHLGGGERG